jgi:hypothetical protein
MTPEFTTGTHTVRIERRTYERRGVDNRATVILVRSGAQVGGTILDVSLGGCRIQTAENFPLGIYTRVETEFRLAGITFRLGGVVQVLHGRRGLGIRFLEMTERKRGQLVELIEEIDAMRRQDVPANPAPDVSA